MTKQPTVAADAAAATDAAPVAPPRPAPAAQLTFKRTEQKYLLDAAQRTELLALMGARMTPDEHGPATVRNVYYDTPTALLARRSAEHPAYKEKIRTRCYGVPHLGEPVFLELKKKCDGVVYKRRVHVSPARAAGLLGGTVAPATQIEREIAFAASRYEGLAPVAYLAYDRQAFFSPHDRDFRMTLDANVRVRWECPTLDGPDVADPVLPPRHYILEVKTGCAMPLWLVRWLSANGIRRTSVSKYGRAWQLRGMEGLPVTSRDPAAVGLTPAVTTATPTSPTAPKKGETHARIALRLV